MLGEYFSEGSFEVVVADEVDGGVCDEIDRVQVLSGYSVVLKRLRISEQIQGIHPLDDDVRDHQHHISYADCEQGHGQILVQKRRPVA